MILNGFDSDSISSIQADSETGQRHVEVNSVESFSKVPEIRVGSKESMLLKHTVDCDNPRANLPATIVPLRDPIYGCQKVRSSKFAIQSF